MSFLHSKYENFHNIIYLYNFLIKTIHFLCEAWRCEAIFDSETDRFKIDINDVELVCCSYKYFDRLKL